MIRDPGASFAAALRWRWILVVLIALPFTIGAVAVTESLPSRYDTAAVLSFTPAETVGADEMRMLLPKYPEYLTSSQTLSRAAAAVGVESRELRSGLRITTPSNTANLQIAVTLEDPEVAAAAANALAAEAQQFSTSDALLSSTVVSEAVPPEEPSSPPRRLIELFAAMIGLLAGVVAAILVERTRPRLWSSADIEVTATAPVIGRLPEHPAARHGPADAMLDRVVGGHVRNIRTDLYRRGWPGARGRVLTVTAPTGGHGATTLAILLAYSFAVVGSKTLLIDGDLDEPAVGRRLSLDGIGLSAVLRGTAALESVAQEFGPNLSVLVTAPDDQGSDLLATQMRAVLEHARKDYDTVVIDAPALLQGDTATTLATLSEGVLLVIGQGSPVSKLQEAESVLERLGVTITGVVANRFSSTRLSVQRRAHRVSPGRVPREAEPDSVLVREDDTADRASLEPFQPSQRRSTPE